MVCSSRRVFQPTLMPAFNLARHKLWSSGCWACPQCGHSQARSQACSHEHATRTQPSGGMGRYAWARRHGKLIRHDAAGPADRPADSDPFGDSETRLPACSSAPEGRAGGGKSWQSLGAHKTPSLVPPELPPGCSTYAPPSLRSIKQS